MAKLVLRHRRARLAAGGLGMALGGLLAGVLFDVTGSYQLSFAISLIGGVGAALIAMTLQPPNRSWVGGHARIRRKPAPIPFPI